MQRRSRAALSRYQFVRVSSVPPVRCLAHRFPFPRRTRGTQERPLLSDLVKFLAATVEVNVAGILAAAVSGDLHLHAAGLTTEPLPLLGRAHALILLLRRSALVLHRSVAVARLAHLLGHGGH